MTTVSETDRLRQWLIQYGIEVEGQALLRPLPESPDDRRRLVRLLNRLESCFDEAIALDLGMPLGWAAIREELDLYPPGRNPWAYISDRAREIFTERGYPPEQVERAERLWRDFLLLQEGQIKPLQASAGWVAALDYLLQSLYFSGEATQAEIGARYNMSASTVGLRFRALVDTLGVVLYDHKARKRLAAARALTVEAGRMSEAEFHRRLLRGEVQLANPSVGND
jgi:hypothetical protein